MGGHQTDRVGMTGLGHHLIGGSPLHDLSGIHERHLITNGGGFEIMGDQQQSGILKTCR
jgi:hypothetical protein